MATVNTGKWLQTDKNQKINDILLQAHSHRNLLTGFGFSRGVLGLSLLYSLQGEHTGDQAFFDKARKRFDDACLMISEQGSKAFYLDLAELGILTEYLHKKGVLDLEPNEFLSDVDGILHSQMRNYLSDLNIGGFVNGAMAMGLYFLHRFSSNPVEVREILRELIHAIEEQAMRTTQGWYWKSRLNPREERIYLTLPHGSAATILFLSKIAERGIVQPEDVRNTVSQAISLLLHHEIQDSHFHFPDFMNETERSRLALCYGDMGAGYALLRAGQVFDQESWWTKGFEVLQNCARRRSLATTSVMDASLLFGATGLGLFFDKIHALTHRTEFDEAARYWHDRVSDFAGESEGFAGFKAAYNQWHPHTNLSFCEGIIGIGAGMIRTLQKDNADFDELIWIL
jgi:lantibiotic biosynthesis protein